MKNALIIGISGQDGYYLANLLLERGYQVFGIVKDNSNFKHKNVKIFKINALVKEELYEFILHVKPAEIYQLAAHHFSSEANGNFKNSVVPFIETNLFIISNVLEVVNIVDKRIRVFYASSCHIFGNTLESPQTENTELNPQSLYGISKAAAVNLCNFYRSNYKIYVSVGILYNHESIRRSNEFVTSKIALAAAKTFLGEKPILKLKNLNAIIDWGAAEDYVKAMWLTLQQNVSHNYIISSGIGRSVKDFAKIAFQFVGKNYKDYVFQDESESNNDSILIGNSNKIREYCKWAPEVKFEDLITKMVSYKIQELKN